MAETSGASAGAAPSRGPALLLVTVLRWLAVIAAAFLSLLALGWIAFRLAPGRVPAPAAIVVQTGVNLLTELLVILAGLAAVGVALTGLRRWGAPGAGHALPGVGSRAAGGGSQRPRGGAGHRPRRRRAAGCRGGDPRRQPGPVHRADPRAATRFRDLLRRIETAFIPVARRYRTRGVDGHGDGFLFCFERADEALAALREMYGRLPAINQAMPGGVNIAFRASLHVGPTFTDTRGNRSGLTVLKTIRLGGVMEMLQGRGAGRNSLVVSDEARAVLEAAGDGPKLHGAGRPAGVSGDASRSTRSTSDGPFGLWGRSASGTALATMFG